MNSRYSKYQYFWTIVTFTCSCILRCLWWRVGLFYMSFDLSTRCLRYITRKDGRRRGYVGLSFGVNGHVSRAESLLSLGNSNNGAQPFWNLRLNITTFSSLLTSFNAQIFFRVTSGPDSDVKSWSEKILRVSRYVGLPGWESCGQDWSFAPFVPSSERAVSALKTRRMKNTIWLTWDYSPFFAFLYFARSKFLMMDSERCIIGNRVTKHPSRNVQIVRQLKYNTFDYSELPIERYECF